jgi:integrase
LNSELRLLADVTGLRQGNVTGLRWSQVNWDCRTVWLPANKAKGRKNLYIPLNDLAIEILKRQADKHPERVFTYKGKPITWANTRGWRNALKRAGIADFRWHDLRHTWASWLIQNGTPLFDLQVMGGWKSAEMVQRYAHFSGDVLAQHSSVLDRLLYDTFASRGQKALWKERQNQP